MFTRELFIFQFRFGTLLGPQLHHRSVLGGDVWRRPIRWIIAGKRIKRFGNLRMF
jgi:hypothetical protein